jgi:hypothetical protein
VTGITHGSVHLRIRGQMAPSSLLIVHSPKLRLTMRVLDLDGREVFERLDSAPEAQIIQVIAAGAEKRRIDELRPLAARK